MAALSIFDVLLIACNLTWRMHLPTFSSAEVRPGGRRWIKINKKREQRKERIPHLSLVRNKKAGVVAPACVGFYHQE
ncbi:MAG: hypothetical protein AB1775_06070 [Bacteroidota bacterium]